MVPGVPLGTMIISTSEALEPVGVDASENAPANSMLGMGELFMSCLHLCWMVFLPQDLVDPGRDVPLAHRIRLVQTMVSARPLFLAGGPRMPKATATNLPPSMTL